MIRISLGNVGSGKTASEVREIFQNPAKRLIYTNIATKKISHARLINAEMIIKKEIVDNVTKKDGKKHAIYQYQLNKEFWQNIHEPISVVLDEAHAIINSRRSMSKVNIIVTDWIALLRRVLGSNDSGFGELVLITQLPHRIDIIAREMATQVRYHVCHYRKVCKNCHLSFWEHSEQPESRYCCPKCNGSLIKKDHVIEIWRFRSMAHFEHWRNFNERTFYSHYIINDIERYFPLYNTLQWDNMFSEFY